MYWHKDSTIDNTKKKKTYVHLKCHSEHLQHSLHTHLYTQSLAQARALILSHSHSFRLHVCISFTHICHRSSLLLRCASTHIFSPCFRSLISKRIVFHTKDLSFSSPFISGEIVALSTKHGIKCNKYTLPFCISNSVLYLPFSLASCVSVYVVQKIGKWQDFLQRFFLKMFYLSLFRSSVVFFSRLSQTCFICSYGAFFVLLLLF